MIKIYNYLSKFNLIKYSELIIIRINKKKKLVHK